MKVTADELTAKQIATVESAATKANDHDLAYHCFWARQSENGLHDEDRRAIALARKLVANSINARAERSK